MNTILFLIVTLVVAVVLIAASISVSQACARATHATRVSPVLFRHPYPRSTSSSAHYLGVGKQSVKGTGVAPTVFAAYQGTVDEDHGMAADAIREAGLGPYVSRNMKTGHDPAGGWSMAWRPRTLMQLCTWFLGTDTVSGSSIPYLHTVTPNESVPTWLTTEIAAGVDGDIIERYVDSLLKTLNISVDGNGDLMASWEWFALSPLWRATAATPAYETGVSGVSPGGPFRGAEMTYTIDGVAASNVRSFEIDLEWSYDEDIRNGSVTRTDAVKLELSGTVKVRQLINATTDVDEYRKVNYGTAAGTVASRNVASGSFVAVANNGLATTNLRTLTITVPQIAWTSAKKTPLNPDGETMYLELEGTIEKAAASAFVTIAGQTADATAY
jgi:hypothetical protein